jgi:hypothetical protein
MKTQTFIIYSVLLDGKTQDYTLYPEDLDTLDVEILEEIMVSIPVIINPSDFFESFLRALEKPTWSRLTM